MHCHQRGRPEIERHLAFREYLIAQPGEAAAYGRLKAGLAKEFPADIVGYMNGKDAWIKDGERKALAGKKEQ